MLKDQTEVIVRFNEADPLGIVWHGHYVRYFEDGREAFGKRFGISYLDFYHQGLAVPVVSVQCDFKKPLRYGDSVIVESTFINSAAAKMKFEYKIFESRSNALVATGSSLQVFVDAKTFALQLTTPDFFEAWKKKWNLGPV
ncbi:MAG TPA: acyl-CoA thioesterase [Chitinophagaceae bacterium]|nr:acyl-CoA thioesterase [Chitinophagaceae bacterium]